MSGDSAYISSVPPRKTGGLPNAEVMNVFGRKLRALRLQRSVGLQDMVAKLQASGWDIGEINYAHMEAGRRIIADAELVLILKTLKARLRDLED